MHLTINLTAVLNRCTELKIGSGRLWNSSDGFTNFLYLQINEFFMKLSLFVYLYLLLMTVYQNITFLLKKVVDSCLVTFTILEFS